MAVVVFSNLNFVKYHKIHFKLLLVPLLLLLSLNGARSARGDKRTKFISENLEGDGTTMTEMMDYLYKFGYIPKPDPSALIAHLTSGDEITNAIKMAQKLAHLPETGVLDDATSRFIKKPRCGVSDKPLIESMQSRRKRFAINKHGTKWMKNNLKWRLDRSTSKVHITKVLWDLRRAFKLWSDSSALQFHEVDRNDEADIVISFEYGDHGDGHKFDGKGTILAHAFPPFGSPLGGDMHMDEEENWKAQAEAKLSSDDTASVFVVAAHELGHSLGLSHSIDTNALMFAGYAGPIEYERLPSDDEQAIQYLYGPNTGKPVQPPVRPTPYQPPYRPPPPVRTTPYQPPYRPPPPVRPTHRPQPPLKPVRPTNQDPIISQAPDLCHTTFDAVATIRGELYIFKDEYMWRITPDDHLYGPMLITSYWLGLPKNLKKIDAAYEKPSGGYDIVLFSGDQYWTFRDREVTSRYPQRLTSMGLPSQLPNLDATLVWGHNGNTYFFSKDQYWKYDERRRNIVQGYPKPLAAWDGVPSSVTSALRWKDGTTYFFKDRLFWKFNDTSMKIDHPTGRLTNAHWFNCPDLKDQDYETNRVDRSQHAAVKAKESSTSSLRHDPCLLMAPLILTFTLKWIQRIQA